MGTRWLIQRGDTDAHDDGQACGGARINDVFVGRRGMAHQQVLDRTEEPRAPSHWDALSLATIMPRCSSLRLSAGMANPFVAAESSLSSPPPARFPQRCPGKFVARHEIEVTCYLPA